MRLNDASSLYFDFFDEYFATDWLGYKKHPERSSFSPDDRRNLMAACMDYYANNNEDAVIDNLVDITVDFLTSKRAYDDDFLRDCLTELAEAVYKIRD